MWFKITITPYQFKIKLFLLIIFIIMTSLFLYDEPNIKSIITYVKYDRNNLFQNIRRNRGRQKNLASNGLDINDYSFILNNRPFTILSGSIHYFRVHPNYWMDRLIKLKSAGLNTVTTYIPWNMHQKCRNCSFDFSGILNIRKFLTTAQNLGLFVILRPGPYICAEWEFGGLPSWLLTDPAMRVRSMESELYTKSLSLYLAAVVEEVHDLQFRLDGSVIAWQVENELASYYEGRDGDHARYLSWLVGTFVGLGVTEFLFTADGDGLYTNGRAAASLAATGVYGAVNFQKNVVKSLNALKRAQPKKPLFVAEFWGGWFDHWGHSHKTLDNAEFAESLELILQHGASVNIYMFHGGTSFGFMNGANAEPAQPHHRYTVTSYDYDAAVSESGNLTTKYTLIRQLVLKYHHMFGPHSVSLPLPPPPKPIESFSYGTLVMDSYMPLDTVLNHLSHLAFNSDTPSYIEEVMGLAPHLPLTGTGYVNYRTRIGDMSQQPTATLKIHSRVRDRANVYLSHRLLAIVDDTNYTYEVQFVRDVHATRDVPTQTTFLDILVENMGRVNFNYYSNPIPEYLKLDNQRKGLSGKVTYEGQELKSWTTYPLDFNEEWLESLPKQAFVDVAGTTVHVPGLFKGILDVEVPMDTFVYFSGWQKGCIFVNNFNIGRYWNVGPSVKLYVPGPLLHKGRNEILIWETEHAGLRLNFLSG